MDDARLAELSERLLNDGSHILCDGQDDVVELIAEVRRLRFFLASVTVVCQNCGHQGLLPKTEPFVCVCGAPLKEPDYDIPQD